MTETEVAISAAFELSGTLTIPEQRTESDRVPAVLMIHGSGPIDRDENHSRLKMQIFKVLTEAIAATGIATLRYDKRGTGKSGGSYLEAGMIDLVDDAEAALRYLLARPEIDPNRVFLLGHSEGCILSPQLYTRVPSIAGIVFIAGPAESLRETVRRQNEAVGRDLLSAKGLGGIFFRLLKIDRLIIKQQTKTFERVGATDAAVVRVRGSKLNAKWFREHFAYNVSDDLPRVVCPVLAVVGSKDAQVLPEHSERIAELVSGASEWKVIPQMTHLLRIDTEHERALDIFRHYRKSVLEPVSPQLLQVVTDWLRRQARVAPSPASHAQQQ